MASSSSSGSESPPPPTAFGRPVKKTFLLLTHRVNCVPRRGQLAKLVVAGRVRDITIYPSYSKEQMFDVIKSNIPAAAELDPERIRIFRSTSRGSSLEKVANGIVAGNELLRGLSGSKSDKVLLLYKRPHRQPSGRGTPPPPPDNTGNSVQETRTTPSPSPSPPLSPSAPTAGSRPVARNLTPPSSPSVAAPVAQASGQQVAGDSTPPPIPHNSPLARNSTPALSPSQTVSVSATVAGGSRQVHDISSDEEDMIEDEALCSPRNGFHGRGIRVGMLAENSKYLKEAHKAVFELDYIHSMCADSAGDLVFLPPGFTELSIWRGLCS